MAPKIVLLPGDGIGPEVTTAAVEVLSHLADFDFAEYPFGAAAITSCGTPLTPEALEGFQNFAIASGLTLWGPGRLGAGPPFPCSAR